MQAVEDTSKMGRLMSQVARILGSQQGKDSFWQHWKLEKFY
jgi:hypothetical protein